MKKWTGLVIILIDILASIAGIAYIHYSGKYKGDFIGLILDIWDYAEVALALLIFGLTLYLEIKI